MRPADALVKLRTIIEYSSNDAFEQYSGGILAAVGMAHGRETDVVERRIKGAGWAEVERRALQTSEVFHVASHMTDVVYGASATLDDTDVLNHDMMPAENGIAFFDEPLKMIEARGQQQRIHAVSWHVGGADYANRAEGKLIDRMVPGVWLTFWGASNDPEDEVMARLQAGSTPEALARLGPYHPIYISHLAWGHRAGPAMTHHATIDDVAKMTGDTFKVPGEDDPGFGKDDRGLDLPPIQDTYQNHNRPIMALWRLFGQTLVSRQREDVDRATARGMKRVKLPTQVTVITLRRRSTAQSDGEGTVEWGYRFWVRGHWAWRACGPGHPLAEPAPTGGYRARIYIAPFAKNADREDLPWLVTEKVNTLQR